MRVFQISPSQFGLLVSVYTFTASISGLLAAMVIDRWGRKSALLILFSGFLVATFACAMAPTYPLLLAARALAGGFGGTTGAMVFSAMGDMIPPERRGQATGSLMASFSIASILGVPLSLWIANQFGWHAPFLFLTGSGLIVLVVSAKFLPVMKDHLVTGSNVAGASMSKVWRGFSAVLKEKSHQMAWIFVFTMMLSGFSVIPFLSPYMVANVGLKESQLPLIYFFGGLVTFFSSQWIGRKSDTWGHSTTYFRLALASIIPILWVTHMPSVSLVFALASTTFFMVLVSGRMVPAVALMTAASNPKARGSFMNIASSVQQLGTSIASFVAGQLIDKGALGQLEGFGRSGIVAVLLTGVALFLSTHVRS